MFSTRVFAIFLFYPPLGLNAQDQVTLRDGSVVAGTFIGGTTRSITMLDQTGGTRRFSIADVRSVEFGVDQADSTPAAPANGYPSGRFLPIGTEIAVRTNETIDSANTGEGQTYSAIIDRDVMGPNGAAVIPRGADARLVIRTSSGGGAFGTSQLDLDLDSVIIQGHRYIVSTEDIERSGGRGVGTNSRTAKMVGGGTVLGTLLGAIAGGGRGAAIGAVAGAVAGGTTQVLTRGSQVKVPVETVLTFRLDQPLRLRAQ